MPQSTLGLRAGEWVEVRNAEEILSTLDERGRLEGLPFMPEMLSYCGRRMRVFKSAHKTCDTIAGCRIRSMTNAVHLEGARCDGASHGGCQAACLIFWKEAWLRRLPERRRFSLRRSPRQAGSASRSFTRPVCDVPALNRATRAPRREPGEAERYSCQATDLQLATKPLRWWDPRQYVKDIASGNVRIGSFVVFAALGLYNQVMHLNWRGRRFAYPAVRGRAGKMTPTEMLDLEPGELVEVRSREEIMETLNPRQRNRGLFFDVEMLPYCGKQSKVLAKVEKIIDERTGFMIELPGACHILEGFVCGGRFSRGRLFCPRSIYPYLHEIWLRRVRRPADGVPTAPEEQHAGASGRHDRA